MMRSAIRSTLLVALGALLALAIPATSHTPCDNVYDPPPVCRYVQVVNPYTGKLQQEYVCD